MEEALKYYGLGDKEIQVYLSALKLGSSTANSISVESNLRRSTTYEVLESLKSKGLISVFVKDGKNHFEAADPKRLISLLKEKESAINNILPDLEGIKGMVSEKPSVELFIGKNGVKTIFEELLNEASEFWTCANADIFERLRFYFPNFVKRRIEKGIKARVIENRSNVTEKHKEEAKEVNREIKLTNVLFKSNFFIYGNKLVFIILKDEEIMGIKISNKFVADMQRQMFEFAWKVCD